MTDFPLDEIQFRLALDPKEMVRRYSGFGGAQPDEVRAQFELATDITLNNKEWHDATLKRLKCAENSLELEFSKILNHPT